MMVIGMCKGSDSVVVLVIMVGIRCAGGDGNCWDVEMVTLGMLWCWLFEHAGIMVVIKVCHGGGGC